MFENSLALNFKISIMSRMASFSKKKKKLAKTWNFPKLIPFY